MPLYSKETEKALVNFQISGIPFSSSLAKTIAMTKIAAARAHTKLGTLPKEIGNAIETASQEIIDEKWNSEFVVDQIQGGAGTSIHMNVNEVIATRASEILNNGTLVHPNDHVNLSQSTNDVVPTAIKLTALLLLDELLLASNEFCLVLEQKAKEFSHITKVGRTHLQDAVPITLGQEFGAHAYTARKDEQRIKKAKQCLYEMNLGGSAVGTGLTGSKAYIAEVTSELIQVSGYPVFSSPNLIAATQYPDAFLEVSSVLTVVAANLIKFANDIRLLASGPLSGFQEIQLEERQKGSSIMPGKVNPVVPETLNQICFQIIGNNQTILMAIQAGQLELNVMLPIVAKNLFESLSILKNGLLQMARLGITSLRANEKQCFESFSKSLSMATALSPKIGYDKTALLVKKAISEQKSLMTLLQEEGIMTPEEYTAFFTPKHLTEVE